MTENGYILTDNLLKDIKSGNYHPTPVELGNLTLKLGYTVDQNPSEQNLQIALSILIELLSNALANHDMIVWEALTHKLEYLASKYGDVIPTDQLRSLVQIITDGKAIFIDWLKSLPPESNVNVLRRVQHSTLYYDFDGFLDALGISESQDYYEIASIPVKVLMEAKGVPPREVVKEDKPERNRNYGGSGNDDDGNNPNGPRYAYATKPQTPPPPSNPPKNDNEPKEEKIWRDVDVLDLVIVSVLNSLIADVKPIDGGCRLILKPEVMDIEMPWYKFDYEYKTTDNGGMYYTTDTMMVGNPYKLTSGAVYACQFLEIAGFVPQLGADGSIAVHCDKEDYQDFLNIINLETLYTMSNAVTRDELSALSIIAVKQPKDFPHNLRKYTAFAAHRFWNNQLRLREYMESKPRFEGRVK